MYFDIMPWVVSAVFISEVVALLALPPPKKKHVAVLYRHGEKAKVNLASAVKNSIQRGISSPPGEKSLGPPVMLHSTTLHAPYSFLPQQRCPRILVVVLAFTPPARCPVSSAFPHLAFPPAPRVATLQDAVSSGGGYHPVSFRSWIIVIPAGET